MGRCALLRSLGVKSYLLCLHSLNQMFDPIEDRLIRDAGRHDPVMFDLIELDAPFTHRSRLKVTGGKQPATCYLMTAAGLFCSKLRSATSLVSNAARTGPIAATSSRFRPNFAFWNESRKADFKTVMFFNMTTRAMTFPTSASLDRYGLGICASDSHRTTDEATSLG
jgi:hypothetical protein